MDKTETNQKQRPTTLGMDQFLSPFTIKMGSCMHRSSVVDYLAVVERLFWQF